MPLKKMSEFGPSRSIPKSKQTTSLPSDTQLIDPDDWDYREFASPGLGNKPSSCKMCPYSMVGQGFCPDYKSSEGEPKIALLLEAPGATEVVENSPLMGRAGELMWERIVPYSGLSRKDFLISNTIRCRPPDNKYPSSFLKRNAENNCRMYDKYLLDFDPNIFLITYHPASVFRQLVYLRLIQEDIKKAKGFWERGFRPLVLMGDKAVSLLNDTPFKVGKGGLRFWRGHFWEGEWPFWKDLKKEKEND